MWSSFDGSREPVVDEPLNNSLGQAWNSLLFFPYLSLCLFDSCSNSCFPAVSLSLTTSFSNCVLLGFLSLLFYPLQFLDLLMYLLSAPCDSPLYTIQCGGTSLGGGWGLCKSLYVGFYFLFIIIFNSGVIGEFKTFEMVHDYALFCYTFTVE